MNNDEYYDESYEDYGGDEESYDEYDDQRYSESDSYDEDTLLAVRNEIDRRLGRK